LSRDTKVRIARPYHDEKVEPLILSILRSGRLVQGQVVKEFEANLSKYLGIKHVIAVNSGTAAIHAALSATKASLPKEIAIPEVITTPLSFSATANAIMHAGCRPIFVDVDKETFNLDTTLVEDKITSNTIAIEPVDVYGLPARLDAINSIAKANELTVVEDAAEAIGASYKGRRVGSISTLTCFSTYATKNLHTGEGGFVTTNDDKLAEYLRVFRNQGQVSKYNQTILGYNYRMLEICAAIGNSQLQQIDQLNAKRRINALRLRDKLDVIDCLGFQHVDNPSEHAWYMLGVTLDEEKAPISRDKLVSELNERGIEADVAWPTPIHLQGYYRTQFGFKPGDYPKAERICKCVFQLPIQPLLTEIEVQRIASTITDLLRP
jgi:perosamine synthetase